MLPELKEVRERRIRLGLSQRELARSVGTSQSNIAKIERGKINPPYTLVKRIFTALDKVQATGMGRIGDVATEPVVSVEKSDRVQRALEILQGNRYKQLPVKDKDLWVGCIYERTITRHLTEGSNPNEILGRQVGSVMDEALPTVSEETPLPTVIPLLQQTQAALVTRRGKVVGIATNADLLKVVRPDSVHFVLRKLTERKATV